MYHVVSVQFRTVSEFREVPKQFTNTVLRKPQNRKLTSQFHNQTKLSRLCRCCSIDFFAHTTMDQLNHSNGLKAASKRHEHEFHGVRFGGKSCDESQTLLSSPHFNNVAEIQGSWLYDQQPTTLVVGSNYFSISNHGMV